MSKIIRELCEAHTYLTNEEIENVIEVSKSINMIAEINECDAFIDVPSKNPDEAVVVAEGRAEKSVYNDSVVGKLAIRENEPCVITTLETGEIFKGVRAITQENRFVKQRIHPIKHDNKIIGVIILEEDISEEVKENFMLKGAESPNEQKKTLQIMRLINSNEIVGDNLDVAILVYDKQGVLKIKNERARSIYNKIGYRESLVGTHYDELPLDKNIARNIKETLELINGNILIEEKNIGDFIFKVKTILIEEDELGVMEIIEDITDIRNKEAEIISKSVAIQEIHHRVKNNLQTVASLLRIQGRRCSSDEAKASLQESVNRILAIASTHELLSKDIGDEVKIMKVINAIVDNIKRCFSNIQKDVEIEVTGDDFYAKTDRITAIALIINELLQNCYDHAFKGRDSGYIKINVLENEDLIIISITDNGVGFDVEKESGSSIGMSIVKNYIADKLRGVLEINSGEGGTRIKFYFPTKLNNF